LTATFLLSFLTQIPVIGVGGVTVDSHCHVGAATNPLHVVMRR
jgi:hypothetical protein